MLLGSHHEAESHTTRGKMLLGSHRWRGTRLNRDINMYTNLHTKRYNELNLHRGVEGKLVRTNSRAGMPAALTENIDE